MPNNLLKCISCSNVLIRWGKTSSGKKRYRCRNCGVTCILGRGRKKKEKLFRLFRNYVLWGDTYEQLSSLSQYSVGHLIRVFHQYLNNPPNIPVLNQKGFDTAFLLIDGLWFGRWFVLMVYRQSKNLTILHISVAGKETSTKISKDLKLLKNYYSFTGIISDGQTGIVKAVNEVYPDIPHQICLAHLHRDLTGALGHKSQDARIVVLRALADWVWKIESKEALRWWSKQVETWYWKNWQFLCETRKDADTGKRWYIHKGVRKAFGVLRRLPHTSFVFLDHPTMPKTTNELEAQFKHLGKRWQAHSGLKRERWENFLKWFVYFYNKEKQSSSK